MVPVGALTPNQRNANQGDLGAVLGSIKTNRFYGAVMAQKSTGTIIAGEYRWRAAQEAGLEVVPVIYLDVTDAEAQRIMVADNRTTRLGLDDPLKMSELLNSIISDFGDLEGTGYDREDLDQIIADLGDAAIGLTPQVAEATPNASLADRFGVPPFSVLDARQGYWQARKKAWLALGIQSELGRGGA